MDSRRGWLVVLGGFLTLFVTAGTAFFVLGVLLENIVEDTGWSFSAVSNAVTVWGLAAAIFSPLCGHLIDRLGARRMILLGVAAGAATMFLVSRAAELWQFYALMIVAAVANMSCTFIPIAAVVARWFVKYRGIATGLAMLATSVGGAAFPVIAARLLDAYSWRETYAIFAGVLACAAIPTLLWVRNPTAEEEAGHLANLGNTSRTDGDLTLGKAIKTRSFWGLSVGDMITGLVFAVFNIHLVYYLSQDLGNDKVAAHAFGLLNLCIAIGTLVFGALGDRLPLRGVLIFCYLFPAVAMPLLIAGSTSVPMVFAFAVLAGLPAGGRNGLFPVGLVYCFGETHLGAIYGLSNSFFMVGNAAGPAISAAIYEETGNTRTVYIVCLGLLIVSAALVSLIRRKPA